jgi:tRNA-dihydrouridine synthase C
MEGVTDAPIRAYFGKRGGFTHGVSEFFRISQDLPSVKVFKNHVPELNTGSLAGEHLPIQVQLLGGNPELLAEAAKRAIEAGAIGVDLNFGCPAPTVNRHDGGATLLKFPQRIRAICEAVRRQVPEAFAVSAKLRLGFDDTSLLHQNVQSAAEGGVSWITLHARTRAQGYQPPADWKKIGEVERALNGDGPTQRTLPIVANGDLFTLDDLKRCQEASRCRHFMVGRGAMANPGLVWELASHLKISEWTLPLGAEREDWRNPTTWRKALRDLEELALPHTSRAAYLLRRAKQWLSFANGRSQIEWFDEVKRCETLESLYQRLETL